jgi:hypothetical protein
MRSFSFGKRLYRYLLYFSKFDVFKWRQKRAYHVSLRHVKSLGGQDSRIRACISVGKELNR